MVVNDAGHIWNINTTRSDIGAEQHRVLVRLVLVDGVDSLLLLETSVQAINRNVEQLIDVVEVLQCVYKVGPNKERHTNGIHKNKGVALILLNVAINEVLLLLVARTLNGETGQSYSRQKEESLSILVGKMFLEVESGDSSSSRELMD